MSDFRRYDDRTKHSISFRYDYRVGDRLGAAHRTNACARWRQCHNLHRSRTCGGAVTFNCGGTNNPATIVLTSQKTITAATTIDGASVITLSGGISTSLFLINSGVTLTLNAITITQGYKSGDGGCLYAIGILVLNNVTMTDCRAVGGRGGGLYVGSTGLATLVNVSVLTNTSDYAAGGDI